MKNNRTTGIIVTVLYAVGVFAKAIYDSISEQKYIDEQVEKKLKERLK